MSASSDSEEMNGISMIPMTAPATTADFAPWMQDHFSEESLELLLGQRKDETKAIAEREEILLGPWEELYPPLEQPRL